MAVHRYHPYYCEENAWHLCQSPIVAAADPQVVVVSNATRSVALWHQRAAPPDEPIAWDYHVLVAARAAGLWQVWDPDSRLGYPMHAGDYLTATFATVGHQPAVFDPRFRILAAATYTERLRSDRSHMCTAGGGWRKPPPPWPPISDPAEGTNLARFIDMDDAIAGEVVTLDVLRARFSV